MRRHSIKFLIIAILLAAPCLTFAASQQNGRAEAPKGDARASKAQPTGAKKSLRVSVTPGPPIMLSLRANKVPMTEVAAELEKELKTPVFLSPLMKQQHLTNKFRDLPIDSVMSMLAPRAMADYELNAATGKLKPLAFYLWAYNEPLPALNTVVQSGSQSIVIEGNTNEMDDASAQTSKVSPEPMSVTFENHRLSVNAKGKFLSAILYAIAEKVRIPFSLETESNEIVDVSFSDLSLEEAVRRLSPGLRLYYRADLQTFETLPLRLVLVASART